MNIWQSTNLGPRICNGGRLSPALLAELGLQGEDHTYM